MGIVWSSSNLKEILPDQLSPLTESILLKVLNNAVCKQYSAYQYQIPEEFGSMINVFQGKAYLNMTLSIRVIEECWGLDSSVIIRSMGGTASGQMEQMPKAPAKPRLGLRVAASLVANTISLFVTYIRYWVISQKKHLLSEGRRQEDIKATILNAEKNFEKSLTRHLMVGMVSAILYDATHEKLGKLIPEFTNSDIHNLLSMSKNAPSLLQQKRLAELAILYGTSLHEPHKKNSVDQHIYNYLAKFGYRCPYEMEISQPRTYEEINAFKKELQRISEIGRPVLKEVKNRASPTKAIPITGWRKLIASIAIVLTQKIVVLRERSKHILSYDVAIMRNALISLYDRIQIDGIQDKQDLFLLTYSELLTLLDGDSSSLQVLTHARKRLPVSDMPESVETTVDGIMLTLSGTSYDSIDRDKPLTGTPVSSGVVEGIVKILHSPEDAYGLNPGNIAVVKALDSGWNYLFAVAGGIVTEVGGMISHAAIVSREMGIPAIFNVPHACDILRDGDHVLLDCNQGTIEVKKINSPPENSITCTTLA